jgi:hypothetical protein
MTNFRLSNIPFDEAFGASASFADAVREGATRKVCSALGLGQQAKKSFGLRAQGERFEIVFSKQTERLLRSGELHLPLDRSSGLLRIDARDGRSRIRELGKVRKGVGAARAAVNALTAAAHMVSAIDTQLQLQQIDRKLDQILSFMHADRLGELRGLYNATAKALEIQEGQRRRHELVALAHSLDVLAGRFYETAKAKLGSIANPAEIGVWEALTTLQSSARGELEEALRTAIADFRAAEFAWLLGGLVRAELEVIDDLPAHRRMVASEIETIRPLLLERTGFLNGDLRLRIREKIDLHSNRLRRQPGGEVAILSEYEFQPKEVAHER